jgi:hypothetical protein
MTEKKTRRGFLGTLGTGAAAALAGCGGIGGDDEEATGEDTLDVLERDLEATRSALNEKKAEYEKSDVTRVDDLLSDGEDVRVGNDGSISEDAVGTDGKLDDDIVSDPEYILSTKGGPPIRRAVDGNDDGLVTRQEFTRFDSGSPVDEGAEEALESISEDLDWVEEDVELGEYFATEDDREAAKAAADEMEGLDVRAATHPDTEQPIAMPGPIKKLKRQVEEELKTKSELYQDIASLGQDIVGIQDNLSGSEGERAQEIRDDAGKLIKRQSEVTGNIAEDIARLSVTHAALDGAAKRSQEIFENAASYDHLESVEVNGESYQAVRIAEVDNYGNMDEESGAADDNYLAITANDLGGADVDDLLAVYGDLGHGEGFYLVNAEDKEELTEAGPFDREDYVDIRDGIYDGNIEA